MKLSENEIYHADTTHISKSGLDLIHKAPAKYYERYLNPNAPIKERSKAFIEGSAFHTSILEPHLFKDEFVPHLPFEGTGSQQKKRQLIAMNPGKQLISMETYNMVQRMQESVMKHPVAKQFFNNGFAERVFKWIDPETGVKCKMKPDWYASDQNCMVDLKSADDASPSGFGRSAFNYRYHVQAPFYTDGGIHNGINSDAFIFIAVEKEPPYLVNVTFADNDAMDLGRRTYIEDLKTYNECKKTGIWTGYEDKITPLELPSWAENL